MLILHSASYTSKSNFREKFIFYFLIIFYRMCALIVLGEIMEKLREIRSIENYTLEDSLFI